MFIIDSVYMTDFQYCWVADEREQSPKCKLLRSENVWKGFFRACRNHFVKWKRWEKWINLSPKRVVEWSSPQKKAFSSHLTPSSVRWEKTNFQWRYLYHVIMLSRLESLYCVVERRRLFKQPENEQFPGHFPLAQAEDEVKKKLNRAPHTQVMSQSWA